MQRDDIKKSLIVSCQPVPGGPTDTAEFVIGFARAAVDAGANQVNGPGMSVADQGALYRKALKAAMDDARLSAETLAAAAGRSLGKVTSATEGGGATPMPFAEKAAAMDSGTPVEAGTQEVTASVTVTYSLS